MNLKYRPEIDGLRAIAVLAVILYHAQFKIFDFTSFKGGYIGVDIFFVISGYLITLIILNELFYYGTFSFRNFYERRIRRIIPILLLVILVSIPFAWFYLLPLSFFDFCKSIIYTLGFSSNFYFHYSGLEYGADVGSLKPFLHTWSLSVEEQFYILFPISVILIFTYFRKYLIQILIVAFFISLVISDWGSKNHASFNFYILPSRGWELLAGSILAYFEITLGKRSNNKLLNFTLPTLGLFMIIYSFMYFDDSIEHPSIYTLIPVIGVCLLIWFTNKNELITNLLSSKIFVATGLISYSLYLWHYPVFIFLESKYFFYDNSVKLFAIFLSLLLAIFSYFTIERYARFKANTKILFSTILFIYIFLLFGFLLTLINSEKILSYNHNNYHHFLDIEKFEKEHKDFEVNYNYDDFDNRINVFIIGNSYTDDLLNVFYYNNDLTKKFYFYTPSSKKRDLNETENYQVSCFLEFLNNNNDTTCKGHDFTSHLLKQYKKSDYIILHQMNDSKYYLNNLNSIIQHLKRDNKKFILLLDDVNGRYIANMNSLDRFVFIYNRLPQEEELQYIENQFYNDSMLFDVKNLKRLKKILNKEQIPYLTRSELFCDHSSKRCKMITAENEKIYADYGHLTNNGAKHFSSVISRLIFELN